MSDTINLQQQPKNQTPTNNLVGSIAGKTTVIIIMQTYRSET